MIIDRIRKFENIHIVFWLIKDSCWMLELRWLGTIAMFPALYIAAYIAYKARKSDEAYVNYAIFAWIIANSFWMLMEFFNDNRLKNYAGIPFAIGFVFVIIYYSREPLKTGRIQDGTAKSGGK